MYEPIIKNKLSIESRIEWHSNQRKNNNIDTNIRKCSESAVQDKSKVKIPGKFYYKKMSDRNLLCTSLVLLFFGIIFNTQFGYTHGLIVRDSSNNGKYCTAYKKSRVKCSQN